MENNDEKSKTLVVTKPLVLDDGLHTGVITRIEYRDTPYQYMDIVIKPDDADTEIKVGYPQNISLNSAAGRLLERFGAKLKVGNTVIPYNILVGKKCQFITNTEPVKMKDGRTVNFARIISETLKPVNEI